MFGKAGAFRGVFFPPFCYLRVLCVEVSPLGPAFEGGYLDHHTYEIALFYPLFNPWLKPLILWYTYIGALFAPIPELETPKIWYIYSGYSHPYRECGANSV